MSRWTAESDRDYEDEVAGRHAPLEVCVQCISCSRDCYVRADEQPPYRCEHCQYNARVAAERQREVA